MFLRIPWYPTLLAATFILNLWIVSGVSVFALTRALVIAVAVVTVAALLLTVLTRRPHVSAAVATILSAGLVSRGASGLAGAAAFAVGLSLVLALWARVQRRPLRWTHVTVAMNVVTLLLLVLTLVGGIQRGTYVAMVNTDLDQGSSSIESPPQAAEDDHPDLLLLLLDGYPRADVLQDEFGFDNSGFLDELQSRGFDVASASESNYARTHDTLISMLHMRPLHEINRLDGLRMNGGVENPLMRQIVNENPVFAALRKHGYLLTTSSPGYEHVALRQADIFLDDGSLNEAERHILHNSPLLGIVGLIAPDAIPNQYRQRILAGFEAFEELATLPTGSTFAFVHVPSPHMPIVLRADGTLLTERPGFDMFRTDPIDPIAREAYVGQIAYLNERTLGALDRVLGDAAADEGPIVVVLSDHGAEPPPLEGESWDPAQFRNFLALRAGDAGALALTDDASPVNVFQPILAALFGEDHPTWANDQFPVIDTSVGTDPSG